MICLTLRFEIRKDSLPAVLEATRAYRHATQQEHGILRCELWQRENAPNAFVLHEVFRDGFARTAHAMAAHTLAWQEGLAPFLVGSIVTEEAESLLYDPIPPRLPVRHRPALQSSSPFGVGLIETGPSARRAWADRPQLSVDLETIEVAAARDHIPLRSPQPCVVLAAFVLDKDEAQGIGRTVYRFKSPKNLPACLTGTQRLLDVPIPVGELPLRVAVVVVSVEENGGSDVQALYQALADAHDLTFWEQHVAEPAPLSLVEGQGAGAFRNIARRVQLLRKAQALGDSLHDDTWAGAALAYFELTRSATERLARFHTAADDGTNDWLLTLRCRVS